MGIYEIIILIAAAIIFIIIIRRFPETADGDEIKLSWFKLPKIHISLPKLPSLKSVQHKSVNDFSFAPDLTNVRNKFLQNLFPSVLSLSHQ